MLQHLQEDLDRADQVQFAVAFLLRSGYRLIASRLWDLLVQRQGTAVILTGDYLDVTDPDALQNLLDLASDPEVGGRLQAHIFQASLAGMTFHPKAYLFVRRRGQSAAYIGSSNLSEPALTTGTEWNYRLGEIPADVQQAFGRLLHHPATVPLTQEWIDSYRRRRRPPATPQPVEVVTEPPAQPPQPHRIQAEALAALEQTRQEGNGAGLVVLATGLGKTWLATFDSAGFERVLFVAHREEILAQAFRTFRIIRPQARLGYFTGKEKNSLADVLFASVQTLAKHYRAFPREAFDYIVIDEFHHACASSYRKILDHFTPRFLLGITATPERTDGGDLLGLCGENVVYRCELSRGINEGLLCPVRYYGVPDTVDYSQIPWRNNKFDPGELEARVATQTRALNAWEQHQRLAPPGSRTVGFCCSQRHADFMRDFFLRRGLRAVSVHSGPGSDHRSESLERLGRGELDIVFSVDVFNEGLDLPQVDAVMMLRPTESRILWLQQLGRGLRKCEGKKELVVIDYIGNHRTFLVKLQTLFMELAGCLKGGDAALQAALNDLAKGQLRLPPGCEVTYELETLDIIGGLLRTAKSDALALWLQDFQTRHGRRPLAREAFHDGYNPRAVVKEFGSWFHFLKAQQALSETEVALLHRHGQFLNLLGTTAMTKSYKMALLEAMLSRVDITQPIGIDELTEAFIARARRSHRIAQDVSASLDNFGAVRSLLKNHPIKAWTGKDAGASFFRYEDDQFYCTVKTGQGAELTELVREMTEWRLADYLQRNLEVGEEMPAGSFLARVSQTSGRPILFLDRARFPDTPVGEHSIWANGTEYTASFVKIALNKVVKGQERANLLPSLLRGWFGPDAGQPGTVHQVQFTPEGSGWTMAPIGMASHSKPVVGHRYAREQIPCSLE